MTSLSLYQNKKRRTNSPSFLSHINETILLMGPHSRQNLSTAHVISYSVLFLESCKIHRGLSFHLPIAFSLTCYNNSSHSREPSTSHIFFILYLPSLLFKLTNQEYDEQSSQGKKDDNMTPFLFIAESKTF